MHYLELVYRKHYFNHAKISVLRLIKMAKKQNQLSGLEQRFVIQFLLDKKCKPCEIYRRCGAHGEACFSKKMCTNGLNMGKPKGTWVRKITCRVETHWLFIKKLFWVQLSVRKVMLTVFWVMNQFPWKRCRVFPIANSLGNISPYLLNDPHKR